MPGIPKDLQKLFERIDDNFANIKAAYDNRMSLFDNVECDIVSGVFDSGKEYAVSLKNLSVAKGAIVISSTAPCIATPIVKTADGSAKITLFFAQMASGVQAVIVLFPYGVGGNQRSSLMAANTTPGLFLPDAATIYVGSDGKAYINPSGASTIDPVFGRRVIYGVDPQIGSTSVTVVGDGALAHFGAGVRAAAPQATHAGYQETIAAGVGGTGIEHANGTGAWGRWDWRQRLSFWIRAPASLATKRAWFCLGTGMSGTAPLAAGSAASASRHIGLSYDSAVSPNWLIQSGDGTNRSGLDTGLAVAADTDYRFVIDNAVSGVLTVAIYVGVLASPPVASYSGSKTTNVPTGTGTPVFEWSDTNLSGVAADAGFIRVAFRYESDY